MKTVKYVNAQEALENSIPLIGDPNIVNAYNAGASKIVDFTIYSTKVFDSSSKELMAAADDKKESITNLNGRKLEAGQVFLLKAIRLQSATITGTTDVDLATAAFSTPADFIANGELEILVSGKTALPRTSCNIFKRGSDDPTGYFELDCPQLFMSLSEIVPTLRVAAGSFPANTTTAVRIELIGALLIPA